MRSGPSAPASFLPLIPSGRAWTLPGRRCRSSSCAGFPFRVPSEPVLKARMTAIEERGGNPFGELSLPDAVVRMRQGFGRLMRRQDDTGCGAHPRSADRHEAIRRGVPGEPAPHDALHCPCRRGPALRGRVLWAKKRGGRRIPSPPLLRRDWKSATPPLPARLPP